MSKKHWIEPNGIFIINIPVNWQYKNAVIASLKENSPYSFEAYEDSKGCFQLSCYSRSDKEFNHCIPVQKSNCKVEWTKSRMDDDEFDMLIWHAQVDDHICMAKCIYSAKDRKLPEVKKLIKQSEEVLNSFKLIPTADREQAEKYRKYDNFLGSLGSSYDLRERAMESKSYIELVAIVSNQIDAFLRMAIVLKKQLINSTDDIEIKYLYQEEEGKKIMERHIFREAEELGIIDQIIFKELNELYGLRNGVIHRFIISHIKTIDIAEISARYLILSEKINQILKSVEDEQIDKGIGIYGEGFTREYIPTEEDQKIAHSMANDKHLMKEFYRKLD